MAPLPHNSTGIYYVDYSFRGQAHTMEFRTNAPTGPVALQLPVQAFLDELTTLMDATWTVLGARGQAAGASISLPVAAPVVTPGPARTVAPVHYPRYVSFGGRGGDTGRRFTVYVYGLDFNTPEDYRFQSGESTELDNARDQLGVMASLDLVTIGGDSPYLYNYSNVGYNSYWERAARR